MRQQLETFQQRLRSRYSSIQQHYARNELERRESLAEVDRLSERLGDVAQNLDTLMSNMQQNSERLRQYLRDNPPDSDPHAESDNDDLDIDLLLTRDLTSQRESRAEVEARLERIFAEDDDDDDDVSGAAGARNPYTLPEHLRLSAIDDVMTRRPPEVTDTMRRRAGDVEARVERLLQERTPEVNPYRLPDSLRVQFQARRDAIAHRAGFDDALPTNAQTAQRYLRRVNQNSDMPATTRSVAAASNARSNQRQLRRTSQTATPAQISAQMSPRQQSNAQLSPRVGNGAIARVPGSRDHRSGVNTRGVGSRNRTSVSQQNNSMQTRTNHRR